MIHVYIASPYTKGDVALNVARSFMMADELINHGFAPFSPLTCHFQHMMFPQEYETWMKLDLAWIGKCDALLRLDGESSGADREVEYANKKGIPVFSSLNALLEYYSCR